MAKPNADRHSPEEIDVYLAEQEPSKRQALEQLRALILKFAPDCSERVSYKIPLFRRGKDLVGISASKSHCSLHTMSPTLVMELKAQLKGIKHQGATIHFLPEQPLPEALVGLIVNRRMQEVA
ncbi:MAG: DUF1801 domain-containing protein [bacterium]|nr:DUF1801 domain-containing protein [bacterium]